MEIVDRLRNNRHGILSLTIRDVSVLYSAYMSFIENGGLFIPTDKAYQIGDEIFALISLLDEAEKIPIAGTVIWITPRNAHGKKAQGIGIQFNDRENHAKPVIEKYLSSHVELTGQTHTM